MQHPSLLTAVDGINVSSLPSLEDSEAAEHQATWASIIDQSRLRLKLVQTGRLSVPETPSADFTYVKNAIMHAIKPYDNFEEIDNKDKFTAILYNMVSLPPSSLITCTSLTWVNVNRDLQQAHDRLTARQYQPCEGTSQTLRCLCLDPSTVGESTPKFLPSLSFWRTTLFFKVSLLRMLMYPLRFARHTMRTLKHYRLGNELSNKVLSHLYGNDIPYPLQNPDFFVGLQHEEAIRIYMLRVGRNGARPVRSDRTVTVATNQITWMTSDTEPIGCPHLSYHWHTFHGGDLAYETYGQLQSLCSRVYTHECLMCGLRACETCKGNILEEHRRKSLSWSSEWGW